MAQKAGNTTNTRQPWAWIYTNSRQPARPTPVGAWSANTPHGAMYSANTGYVIKNIAALFAKIGNQNSNCFCNKLRKQKYKHAKTPKKYGIFAIEHAVFSEHARNKVTQHALCQASNAVNLQPTLHGRKCFFGSRRSNASKHQLRTQRPVGRNIPCSGHFIINNRVVMLQIGAYAASHPLEPSMGSTR